MVVCLKRLFLAKDHTVNEVKISNTYPSDRCKQHQQPIPNLQFLLCDTKADNWNRDQSLNF